MKIFIPPFIASFILSVALMPAIIKYAKRYGIVDKPNERKVHKKPIPLMGGLGILIAFILPLFFFTAINMRAIMIAISLILITVLGILDDIYDIRASKKLIVQLICTCLVVGVGVRLNIGEFFITNSFLAITFDVFISILWCIGIINAINLIDGIDGLAGGVSFISAIGFLIIGVIAENNLVVVLSSLLAGSVLGFLFYNFHPARIFMGDAGSTLLGFCLAIISLLVPEYSVSKSSLYAPVLILGIPILDTGVSILRRAFMKNGIFTADEEHIHHKLLHMGFNQRWTVGIMYLLALISTGVGLIVYNSQQERLGILFIVIYVFYGVAISVKEVYFGETIAQIAIAKKDNIRKMDSNTNNNK
ncbi:MAG: glycosyltransferase family 4 protein [Peptococcales bacterium]|jgi:UDP-GlcNAc:undecaprenyl-phosphate GlcNAc-1-phosphate transferase